MKNPPEIPSLVPDVFLAMPGLHVTMHDCMYLCIHVGIYGKLT